MKLGLAKVTWVVVLSVFGALPACAADSAPVPKPRIFRPDDPTISSFGPFLVATYEPQVIFLAGDIGDDAPLQFLRALKKYPDLEVVVLISRGGLVAPALLIAHEVHDRGLSTYVPSGYDCFSACAYIYFAGENRRVDGRLGVHQVWNESNDAVSSQAMFSNVFEIMREFGVADDVISLMLRTPPDEMHIFADPELSALEINRGSVFEAEQQVAERPEERLAPEPALTSDASTKLTSPEPGKTIVERQGPAKPSRTAGAIAAVDPAEMPGSQSLLLEASDDGTTGAVPFSGTVKWSKGQDESGQPTLIGRANIPARNLRVDLLIRKSSDPSLPASHLMEVNFRVTDSFIGGSIAGVPGVLLKDQELVQGTPLVGASARVVGNSFLFALSAAPSDFTNNVALLRTRRWIDLAVIYATGKRAIITLEKDDAAVALFNEVFEAWKVAKDSDDGILQPGFDLNFEPVKPGNTF